MSELDFALCNWNLVFVYMGLGVVLVFLYTYMGVRVVFSLLLLLVQ